MWLCIEHLISPRKIQFEHITQVSLWTISQILEPEPLEPYIFSYMLAYVKHLCINVCCFWSHCSLMHLLIPTLFYMKYPKDPSKPSPFQLSEKPKTAHLLLEFMLDVLLMPYG